MQIGSKYQIPKLKFLLIGAALLFIVLLTSLFARIYAGQPLSGDQPHYIIMANSLTKQGDLNLKDDYERKLYQPVLHIADIDAHINFGLVKPSSNKWYSVHSPGLPIIIAPILAVAGLKGVMLFMAVIGTLLCMLTYIWTMRLTRHRVGSLLATASLLLSVVYLNLTGYIFVDIPIACCLLGMAVLIDICHHKPDKWVYASIGLIASLSIWLHVKTELMSATILLFALYQIHKSRQETKSRVTLTTYLLVPFIIPTLLLCYEIHRWFGVWLPNQIYQGNNQLFQFSPLLSIPAVFFDSFKGIFTPSPAFLLVFSGLPIWWSKNKTSLTFVLFLVVPSFLVQSTFSDWAGGWGPTGRYPLEWIPLFIPAIAYSLIYLRVYLARIIQLTLLAFGALLGTQYILLRIPWVYAGQGTPLFAHFGIDIYLPYFRGDATLLSGGKYLALLWLCSLGLFALGAYSLLEMSPKSGAKE